MFPAPCRFTATHTTTVYGQCYQVALDLRSTTDITAVPECSVVLAAGAGKRRRKRSFLEETAEEILVPEGKIEPSPVIRNFGVSIVKDIHTVYTYVPSLMWTGKRAK